jgi:hypothetical protein
LCIIPIHPGGGSIERAWQELSKTVIKSEICSRGALIIIFENSRRHAVVERQVNKETRGEKLAIVNPLGCQE